MASIDYKEIDEPINSDITMLAANTFNIILYQVQDSNLNYHLQISPFSAVISLKKSFVKDKAGCLILPPHMVSSLANSTDRKPNVSVIENEFKFQQEFEILQQKHEELQSKLIAANDRIEHLLEKNKEQENLLMNFREKLHQRRRRLML